MKNVVIQTRRLNLCILQSTDLDYLNELDQDQDVRKFFPNGALNKEQISCRMNQFLSYYKDFGLPIFLMFNNNTHEFIGRCGFGPIETGEIEIGYVLHKKFWGQGYATEAVTAMLEWARNNIKAEYIIAFTTNEHGASQRVMQKCGMQYYKTDIGHGVPCKFYRIKNK